MSQLGKAYPESNQYIAYAGIYTTPLSPKNSKQNDKSEWFTEEQCQSSEQQFYKLLEGLQALGYLGGADPLITFEQGRNNERAYTANLTGSELSFVGLQRQMFSFHLQKGTVFNLPINKVTSFRQAAVEIFGEERINHLGYNFHNSLVSQGLSPDTLNKPLHYTLSEGLQVEDALNLVGNGLSKINQLILDAGFEPNNAKIRTLFTLALIRSNYWLVGDMKLWMPYVYSDIPLKNLIHILGAENNQRFNDTQKLDVSLEDAIKYYTLPLEWATRFI